MKITKKGLDAALATAGGVASTVLPVLVENHVLSASIAATIGGVVTAVIAGWHGGSQAQAAKAPTELEAL